MPFMVKRNKIAYNLKVYSARKVAPPVQSSLPCDFDVSFTAQQGTIKMKENCVKKRASRVELILISLNSGNRFTHCKKCKISP